MDPPDFKGSYGIPVLHKITGCLPGAGANLQKPRAMGELRKGNHILKQAVWVAGPGKVVIGYDAVEYSKIRNATGGVPYRLLTSVF